MIARVIGAVGVGSLVVVVALYLASVGWLFGRSIRATLDRRAARRRAGLLVVLALGVSSCYAPMPDATPAGGGSEAYMIEVQGVRCIVWDAYRAGGISCDWGAK